jgi:hypothetical protein
LEDFLAFEGDPDGTKEQQTGSADAGLPLDNNKCEQLMRNVGLQPKNWIFAGNPAISSETRPETLAQSVLAERHQRRFRPTARHSRPTRLGGSVSKYPEFRKN